MRNSKPEIYSCCRKKNHFCTGGGIWVVWEKGISHTKPRKPRRTDALSCGIIAGSCSTWVGRNYGKGEMSGMLSLPFLR